MEIAILGAGKVAEQNYIPALLRHKDVSVSCYSRTFARTASLGQRFGVRAARTLEELFARQPDAVLVLTREDQRLEAAQSLLPFKPKRIFFEKPLVAKSRQAHVVQQDFWDAKALLLRAQQAGAETAMVFNYRFFDQMQRARRLILDRDFGEAISVVALTHFACWSHCIDLIMEFSGSVREVSAHLGSQPYPFEDGEACDVAASFLIGEHATGVLLGTGGMSWNFPLYELTINFERGRIHFRDLDQDMEVLDYHADVHELFSHVRHESRWDKYNQSFEKSLEAYLDSVRASLPPPVPGIAGLLELQFEAGIKKSIAERRAVILSDEFPVSELQR